MAGQADQITITSPITITVDRHRSELEDALLDKALKERPKGFVIVIFKSFKVLYLCKDGKVLRHLAVKKSDLDSAYKFLKGTADDRLDFDFPIPIALGNNPVGRKEKLHDLKTPEGEYSVCNKSGKGQSKYTVALTISYPNAADAKNALEKGEITLPQYQRVIDKHKAHECPPSDTPLGGGVEIHGLSKRDVEKLKQASEKAYHQYLRLDHPERIRTTERDWTFGCIGLEMVAAYYVFKHTLKNTPVVIYK